MTHVSKHSNRTLDHGRVLFTHQHQPNSTALRRVTVELRTSGPSQGGQHTLPNRREKHTGKGGEHGRVLFGTSSVLRKIEWVGRSAVYVQSSGRDLHKRAFDCPFYWLPPAGQTARFNSTWLFFSGLPRSCVHGAVTRLWNHTLISPILFIVSSSPCRELRLNRHVHATEVGHQNL